MAVVDEVKVERAGKAEKADRTERTEPAPAGGLGAVVQWLPRKLGEGRSFLTEVRSELKKVTWPARKEVYSTTLVVIATSIFFGFYLWGLDIAMSWALSLVLGRR